MDNFTNHLTPAQLREHSRHLRRQLANEYMNESDAAALRREIEMTERALKIAEGGK